MIQNYLGFDSDYIIMGLGAVTVLLMILIIVQFAKLGKLSRKLDKFTRGKNGKSLEDTLINRLDQVDDVITQNDENRRMINEINSRMKSTFCNYGIVKYDAFSESGGKLSFVITMLDEKKDGYILNVVHAHDGSYSYIKEVVAGNSIIMLGKEEEESLEKALS